MGRSATRPHHPSDSIATTIKPLICKTKTRAARSCDRPCRAERPRLQRRTTSIARPTNPSARTERSAPYCGRTSTAGSITPRFPCTGLALSAHETRSAQPARRLGRSRGRCAGAERRGACSARRSSLRAPPLVRRPMPSETDGPPALVPDGRRCTSQLRELELRRPVQRRRRARGKQLWE